MLEDKKTIVLVGGGTMGSVSPLLALARGIKKRWPSVELIFIGTPGGVEQEPVELEGIEFIPIISAKLHRFFTLKNILEPFKLARAISQAKKILKKYKPKLVLGAGSFVQLPVMKAAGAFGIPYVIHQLDIRPTLSNRLVAKKASLISLTFDKSLADYPSDKVFLAGNPLHPEIEKVIADKDKSTREAYRIFNLKKDKPVIFITGGGIGALAINELVSGSLAGLVEFCQVIHQVGKGKKIGFSHLDYHQFEYLDQYSWGLACLVSNLAISRAGLASICHFSYLAKPVILIPIPKSHQEENADYLEENDAAVVLDQNSLKPEIFIKEVKDLLDDESRKQHLSKSISRINKKGATEEILNHLVKWI